MDGIQALKRCQIFSALDDVALAAVAASLIEKEFAAGTTISHESDPAVELLIVQEGKGALQMATSPVDVLPSRRTTVDVIGPDDVISWSAVVEPFRYTLSAVCLQDTRVLSISASKLRWLRDHNRSIGFDILAGLSHVIATRLSETRRVLVSERPPITAPAPQKTLGVALSATTTCLPLQLACHSSAADSRLVKRVEVALRSGCQDQSQQDEESRHYRQADVGDQCDPLALGRYVPIVPI